MNRLSSLLTVTLALAATCTAGPIVFVSDFSDPAQIGTLDLGTGLFTLRGTTDAGELVNGPGGVYGFRENGDWVRVAANGATTFIGNSGLAVDEPAQLADGTIYTTDVAHNLYRINPATGAPALVASTGFVDPAGGFYVVALIAGQTNVLYAIATSIDASTFAPIDHARLFQINRNTGAATFLANVNNDSVTCALILNGTPYVFDFLGEVSTLNLATGNVTPLYDLSNSLAGIHGVAAAVPEPATWGMVVFGGALLLLRNRRRS